MRIAIVGTGRMGQAVAAEALARGHEVVTRIGRAENPNGTGLTPERLAAAQVVIEFTRPEAAVPNLERLLGLGLPVVTGTTGWTTELSRVTELVRSTNAALLHAPNFSLGLQLLLEAARTLGARLAARPEFDAALFEQHHRRKVDAPSGTALAIQAALRAADPGRPYPITSERLGWVPGTHGLTADAEFETVTLTHTVRDRRTFAQGAVTAAEWLVGRRGVYTFQDVIRGADA